MPFRKKHGIFILKLNLNNRLAQSRSFKGESSKWCVLLKNILRYLDTGTVLADLALRIKSDIGRGGKVRLVESKS